MHGRLPRGRPSVHGKARPKFQGQVKLDEALSAERLAEAVGRAMYARDFASQALGIALEEIRAGYARMRMIVRKDMVNGHDICHGGFIFTLADSTFAFACNSHDHVTVAQSASIEFLAPG